MDGLSLNPNFALGSRNSSNDAGLFFPKKGSTVVNATLSLFSSKKSRPRSPRFSRPNAKVGLKKLVLIIFIWGFALKGNAYSCLLYGDTLFANWGISSINDNFYQKDSLVGMAHRYVLSGKKAVVRLQNTASYVPRPETFLLIVVGILSLALAIFWRTYALLRRLIDIIGSVVAVSLLFPLVVFAGILIKLDSPGPVFIRQKRVGVNRRDGTGYPIRKDERRNALSFGVPFFLYKLRTMYANAESGTGPVWAKENDARVTQVGKYLRKLRIDEIPQFINVIRGEMRIIGPRPERPVFTERLNERISGYCFRLTVKPGITGLAQTRYRYASTIKDSRKKLKYDMLYIRNNSLLMDAWILIRTFTTVMLAKGAR